MPETAQSRTRSRSRSIGDKFKRAVGWPSGGWRGKQRMTHGQESNEEGGTTDKSSSPDPALWDTSPPASHTREFQMESKNSGAVNDDKPWLSVDRRQQETPSGIGSRVSHQSDLKIPDPGETLFFSDSSSDEPEPFYLEKFVRPTVSRPSQPSGHTGDEGQCSAEVSKPSFPLRSNTGDSQNSQASSSGRVPNFSRHISPRKDAD
ncbi:hypothetical protein IAR55_002072 [Kwoniella newhampshirensis]|uniref:Uncharacterized protein n=1 Tax=Kwoniella newhampshirensis TaxID=1651941 RepID=A0AAW0Z0Q9_9TREE